MPASLDSQQIANARLIISVGRDMGMGTRDIQIALMTALQESSLRNLSGGDRDSAGLFQQRPSQGWGTFDQVTDPHYSSRKFFNTLKTISGRNNMEMTQAAQAVQRSAYPDAYAKWADEAASLLGKHGKADKGTLGATPSPQPPEAPPMGAPELGGDLPGDGSSIMNAPVGEGPNPALEPAVNPALDSATNPALDEVQFGQTPVMPEVETFNLPSLEELGIDANGAPLAQGGASGGDSSGATGWRRQVVDLARQFLGTPYVWGGASPGGFDCSGLLQYIFKQAGKTLPRVSADQARAGKRIGLDALKPGDLIAWDNSSRNNGADHIGVYIGGGRFIEAPRPGRNVQINDIYDAGNAWGVRMDF